MTTSLSINSTLKLNTGADIPVLGFGTCLLESCTSSVLAALKNGYIHIDTAQIYENEAETGVGIARSQLPHSKLFVCSKLWENGFTRQGALNGIKDSLNKLGLDEIDLYLLHVPRPGQVARKEAWLGLQDAVAQKLVKTIGVSNWAPKHFEQLMREDGVHIFPAVNQIEFHPWQQQREIRKYCKEKGIVVVAYSPLAQGTRLKDPTITQLSQKYGKTPAQVVLRWSLQKGVVVIFKSDRESRIVENKGIFNWTLSQEDEALIDALDEGQRGNVGEWNPSAWD